MSAKFIGCTVTSIPSIERYKVKLGEELLPMMCICVSRAMTASVRSLECRVSNGIGSLICRTIEISSHDESVSLWKNG
jgi:hypothetical protein